MRSDARLLLNKKKWKKEGKTGSKGASSVFDARKVINLKRAKKYNPRSLSQTFKKVNASVPVVQRTFSSKAPNKQVMLSNDGNIWITSNSKNSILKAPVHDNATFRRQPKWQPTLIDSDNVEDIGLNDIVDMASLPTAFAQTSHSKKVLPVQRSLAEEMSYMNNTMVADFEAASTRQQTAQVLVTNLCHTVSNQDITELFSDIGLVKNVQMTQPGTALIDFYTVQAATEACHAYHNRLLDGQPMKCQILVDTFPERPSITQRLGQRVRETSQFAPSTSYAQSSRFRYNPNDVLFTVKMK